MVIKSVEKAEEANLSVVEFSISAETFKDAQAKAWNKIKGRVSYPGFRKGKVPRNMAEKLYGKEFLYEDALDICYPEEAEAAIKESGLKMVGVGKVDVKSVSEEGADISIEIYTYPEMSIENYKGLEAEVTSFVVTDAEVDKKIDDLVERNSRMITIEDRAAEMGDIANINFEGFVDDVAFEGGKGDDYDLVLGSGQFIPGFEDQIVGKNIGDEFDVVVTFPEEYGAEELAGKEAVFKCKLNAIKVKELPEVNDEFAQDSADFDTLDELKASLKDEITDRKKKAQDDRARNVLLEKIANIVEGEIPECMINDEVENTYRDMSIRMQSQGLSIEMYFQYTGMTAEDYKAQLKPQAEMNLKIRLALEKIAEIESIEASDEEAEEKINELAAQYNMSADDVKNAVSVEDIKKDIIVEKSVQLIVDNATITEVEPSVADDEAINPDDILDAVADIEDESADSDNEE